MGWERRWWGWGDAEDPEMSEAARRRLGELFGDLEAWPRPVAFEAVSLPEARPLPAAITNSPLSSLLRFDQEARVRHAAGKSFPDLARMREGHFENAPDAVFEATSDEAVEELLRLCQQHSVAVVPFGGGTSVVGGVEALRGEHGAVISLDLVGMDGVEVDSQSLTARLGPGLSGPRAEAALAAAGFTLGHFPQSFEHATIGGFAATRSAGQASTGYGRFDELVTSLKMVTPSGRLSTLHTPHTAAGPSLRQLMLGSEGCFGVITSVEARIKPSPAARRYEAWFAESFEAGSELLRRLAQEGVAPDVIRLSDEEETAISLALAGDGGRLQTLLERYLKLRGVAGGCMIIAGWEGDSESVSRRYQLGSRALRRAGAVRLGRRGGEAWLKGRFAGPYLRDLLMDRGLMVETLETSHTWSGLAQLYGAVGEALDAAMRPYGGSPVVMCHISHVYADGASLYFTFACPADRDDPIAQWRKVKGAASEALVAAGGTITHHHAVGRDHLPWMEDEIGSLGIETLRAVKERLDPAGIMNPGKLVLAQPAPTTAGG
jgi:alkyldihydroxyacetonephosphate synthase